MTDKKYNIIYPDAPPEQPPMPQWHKPAPLPASPEGTPPPPKPDFSKRGLWGAHDPAIYRDPVSGDYFAYCTHRNIYRSPDLINWRHIGRIMEDETPEASFRWTNSHGLWAPDIIKVGDEYRLYCSNSSFGVQLSCIYLVVSDKPEGPFKYRGIVVKTNSKSPVNAIDANLVVDEKTGEQYMAYGSFWGGIKLMKLDPETGLAADKTEAEDGRTADSALGVTIACRPKWCDGGVEGAYIRYNPDTGYYYLFVSYGSLSNDYNIRVGRCRELTGPYIDHNGRPMMDMEDYDVKTGTMIACGYRFENSGGWMGPGHNSVLCPLPESEIDHSSRNSDNAAEVDDWFLVCHIRPYAVYRHIDSTMHVRRILWIDGWPVISPENYAGERLQPIPHDAIAGRYEWITLSPTIPQSVIGSAPATLTVSGTMHISSYTRCKWQLIGDNELLIDMQGGHTIRARVLPAWDHENQRPALVITGLTNDGVAVWGKRIGDVSQRRLPPGGGGPTV